jgi:hypothetical protein
MSLPKVADTITEVRETFERLRDGEIQAMLEH